MSKRPRERIVRMLPILAVVLGTVMPGSAQSLGKLVVMGDSLSAGFQNFSLFDGSNGDATCELGGQQCGFAAQIAGQANVDLKLPLIAMPGLPAAIGSGQTIPGTRENTSLQTLDLAVPGYLLADTLGRVVDPSTFTTPAVNGIDVMAFEVLGYPSVNNFLSSCGVLPLPGGKLLLSELTCAVQQHPDTVLVSIGNNDALQALTQGTQPTAPAIFAAQYDLMLATLRITGAKVVVGNIPDVTKLPFAIPIIPGEFCSNLPNASAGDYAVPNLTNPPTDPTTCDPAHYLVRPAALVARAAAVVPAYNQIIAAEAQKFGAVIVDVYDLFENIFNSRGYVNGSITLGTAAFEGLFSYDLIHPTNSGYAILANTYISAINTAFKTSIPSICLNTIAANDPLVPPGVRVNAQATTGCSY